MYEAVGAASAGRGDKLTAAQVADEFFGGMLSPWSIRDAWRRGQIPGAKICGKLIFSRSELDRWFQEQSRANVERNQTKNEYGKLRQVN